MVWTETSWYRFRSTIAACQEAAARETGATVFAYYVNDPQRLQRALEVFEITGKSMTQWQRQGSEPCPFELLEIAKFVMHRLSKSKHNFDGIMIVKPYSGLPSGYHVLCLYVFFASEKYAAFHVVGIWKLIK